MEASTGTILYEKDADKEKPPASVTKIMTLLLIFDALSKKHITLNDTVTVSEHAASMGGSQVFLEPGETQTVDTMIKCIAVSSANDACVAMAEHIYGSEDAFVAKMNARAQALGMKHTHFINCAARCRRTLYERKGYCPYVTRTYYKASRYFSLYDYMDGKYHSCDKSEESRNLVFPIRINYCGNIRGLPD